MNRYHLFWVIGAIVSAGWVYPDAKWPDGTVTQQQMTTRPEIVWSRLDDRMSIDRDQQTGHPLIRVRYPKHKWGSTDSGAQFMVRLRPAKTQTCSYRVRFPEHFDFVRGGKLPGLAGGKATSGLQRPTGDGWTARLMWRTGGRLVLYPYQLGQTDGHPVDIPLGVSVTLGRWHHIRQRVTVNDDGQANGRVRVWFDHELVLDRTGFRFRRGNAAPVDRFYFSTFFGGASQDWAPPHEMTIDFDRIDPGVLKINSSKTTAKE